MNIIIGIAKKVLKPRYEEDFFDIANYAVTPFVVFMAAVLCFVKEYGPWSQPIYCWANAEWNDEWLEYVHDYCFIKSYYVPMNESIPMRGWRNNADDQVNYYQLLPFILFMMALICQIPHYFWQLCNFISGKNLPTIIRQAHDAVGRKDEGKVAADIGRYLYAAFSGQEKGQQEKGERICRAYKLFTHKICRHMLCFFYLLMKVFSLVTNIGLLFFITYFLGAIETPKLGLPILDAFIQYGSARKQSGLFPHISLCDFKIRMPRQMDLDLTVQCLLNANYLNEKIFVALYYLFAFMFVLNVLNLGWWFRLLLHPSSVYVGKMVELSAMQLHPDPEMPKQLVRLEEFFASMSTDSSFSVPSLNHRDQMPSTKLKDEFMQLLGSDGILIFNLIYVNAGFRMTCRIKGELFYIFIKSSEENKDTLYPA